jgi:hypothetical protein
VSWNRQIAATALAKVLTASTNVEVFTTSPETLNPLCIVIGRPAQVSYSAVAMGLIDMAELPVTIVGGIETEDQVEALKEQCRTSIQADPTLGGAVPNAYPTGERAWRNMTGAGGIQLLMVDLVIQVDM